MFYLHKTYSRLSIEYAQACCLSNIERSQKIQLFFTVIVCDFVSPAEAFVDISREQFLRNFLNFSMQLKTKKKLDFISLFKF